MRSSAKFVTSFSTLLALAAPADAQDGDYDTQCSSGSFKACITASTGQAQFSWSSLVESPAGSQQVVGSADQWMNLASIQRWAQLEHARLGEVNFDAPAPAVTVEKVVAVLIATGLGSIGLVALVVARGFVRS